MAHHRPTISTHVLDTGTGMPRAGVAVRLWRAGDGGAPDRLAGEAVTDDDGRIRDLLGETALEAGAYRLEFALDGGPFFTALAVALRVDDAGRSYHVPLLVAPYGLATYRGS